MPESIRYTLLCCLLLFLLLGCGNPPPKEPTAERQASPTDRAQPIRDVAVVSRDLDEIRKRGTLRAITDYSAVTYFEHRGHKLGFDYELLRRLARHLRLKLEIVLADDVDQMEEMLYRGEGDLIAYLLPILDENDKLAFSDHHLYTHEVLVQRKPENWRKLTDEQLQAQLVTSLEQLDGQKVWMFRNSLLYNQLLEMEEELGENFELSLVPGHLTEEDLIQSVVKGDYDYAIVDELIARVNATYYPMLDVGTPVSPTEHLGWAMRKSSPELKKEVDNWLNGFRNTRTYSRLYDKYFSHPKPEVGEELSDSYFQNTGQLSPYDHIIKQHADSAGLDWRLVAAQIYQESQFDADIESWAGAAGLMQFMPQTAAMYGITDRKDPEQSIAAGVRMLLDLDRSWRRRVPSSRERIKFVLASYNTGIGHVMDAQRLARKYGVQHRQWDGHVSEYLLKKSKPDFYKDPVVEFGYCRGTEPVGYVRSILRRYRFYRTLIPDEGS